MLIHIELGKSWEVKNIINGQIFSRDERGQIVGTDTKTN